jgi:hypothetical protein
MEDVQRHNFDLVLKSVRELHKAVEQSHTIVNRRLDEVDTELGAVHTDLSSTRTELLELRAVFNEFVGEAARVARVQRSETKLGNLKADLDRQYGHYAVVRRTSVGIMQAFDVGNVSNHTVTSISEELMIQSPRYWLAPAIVAVAAWSRDAPDIAEKSVKEAFSRDPRKTSLFFALVLRRQDRTDGAVRWLRHYFAALDPSQLTREFAVILEASAQGAFGPAGASAPAERIAGWMTELRSDPQIVAGQVAKWRQWLKVNQRAVDPANYEALAKISPQWPLLKEELEAASTLPISADVLQRVRDTDYRRADFNDMLDDLLEQLVTEYDSEELPLQREVTFHQAMVDEEGDEQRAKDKADMLQEALEETIDVVSLQTTAAISPEHLGVSVQTQRVSIGAAQPDLRRAIGEHTMEYRGKWVDRVDLVLDGQHSGYASTLGFIGWQGGTEESDPPSMQRLAAAWDVSVRKMIDAKTFKPLSVLPHIAIGVVAVIIMFAISAGFGAIGLLLVAAGVGGYIWWRKTEADKEVAKIRAMQAEATDFSVRMVRQARAEFVDAQMIFYELDGQEPDLLRVIDTWPTGAQLAGAANGARR